MGKRRAWCDAPLEAIAKPAITRDAALGNTQTTLRRLGGPAKDQRSLRRGARRPLRSPPGLPERRSNGPYSAANARAALPRIAAPALANPTGGQIPGRTV